MTILEQINQMVAYSKHYGELYVTEDVSLPYTLLKGEQSQPVLTVVAAVHACEYVGVKTTMELAQKWNFRQCGTVILLHAMNITGLKQNYNRFVPEDGVNLNAIFQENSAEQTLSCLIRDTIQQQIFPYTDFLIDLHGGSRGEFLTPHGYCSSRAKKDVFTKSYEMLIASQTPIIYHSAARGGVYQSAAIDYNIPSILLEQGDNGTCLASDVQTMIAAVQRIADYVFSDVTFEKCNNLREFHNCTYMYCSLQGFWTSQVTPNQYINKNDKIGEIVNIYGEKISDVLAEQSGVVLYHKSSFVAQKGDLLIAIAY